MTRLWGQGGVRLLAGDAAVIALLLTLSMVAFASLGGAGGRAERVEIEVSGKGVLSLSRSEEGLHRIDGPLGSTAVEIREGRVRILSSPCPLKLCQRAGWIGSAGEMIVCLPNEVVVRLPGKGPGGVDAVSR